MKPQASIAQLEPRGDIRHADERARHTIGSERELGKAFDAKVARRDRRRGNRERVWFLEHHVIRQIDLSARSGLADRIGALAELDFDLAGRDIAACTKPVNAETGQVLDQTILRRPQLDQ